MRKFIIEPDMKKGTNVTLLGQDARHISRALRLSPGDPLSMTDGLGMDWYGKITEITQGLVRVKITAEQTSKTESCLDLTLCTAMLKHKKMDDIIKQAVQLGITRWLPFFSNRSVPLSNPKKTARQMERWQTISRESLKQCRRSRLVDIQPPMTLEDVLDMTRQATHKIAFWEESERSLCRLKNQGEGGAVVLIGPEGGFEASEIRMAEENGFKAYSLGPRILRAETAAVSATGLVQYILGDLGE